MDALKAAGKTTYMALSGITRNYPMFGSSLKLENLALRLVLYIVGHSALPNALMTHSAESDSLSVSQVLSAVWISQRRCLPARFPVWRNSSPSWRK
eukprot:3307876-Amphidinium_carterae.1